MTDDKIVPFRVIPPSAEKEADEAAIKEQQDGLIKALAEDAPFDFLLGVARKMDGTVITFGTEMDVRDYVFGVEVLKLMALDALAGSMDAL